MKLFFPTLVMQAARPALRSQFFSPFSSFIESNRFSESRPEFPLSFRAYIAASLLVDVHEFGYVTRSEIYLFFFFFLSCDRFDLLGVPSALSLCTFYPDFR